MFPPEGTACVVLKLNKLYVLRTEKGPKRKSRR